MSAPNPREVVTTNENDVLDEFFRTGNYRPRPSAETYKTSSPSKMKRSKFDAREISIDGEEVL